ncbi:MAG TPA: hypothetical protein VK186_24910 [Candidatus Deferrimicrobium sp.]|nr:hypothetical protein [Candidatus Deferrimicrobium sp.]
MENTIEQIDMKILPKEARRILVDEETIIEDLLPKKVCNFVPLKREEIYGR